MIRFRLTYFLVLLVSLVSGVVASISDGITADLAEARLSWNDDLALQARDGKSTALRNILDAVRALFLALSGMIVAADFATHRASMISVFPDRNKD